MVLNLKAFAILHPQHYWETIVEVVIEKSASQQPERVMFKFSVLFSFASPEIPTTACQARRLR